MQVQFRDREREGFTGLRFFRFFRLFLRKPSPAVVRIHPVRICPALP
jgi:hypothetical protein